MWMGVFAELTESVRIIEFEAAEDLVGVSGMAKSISSHHHLETLWERNERYEDIINVDNTQSA